MKIEFDLFKSKSNQVKHGVSFEEAATALLDPMALVKEDPDCENEHRWILVGISYQARLLTVVYTLREENIRLISARKATRKEEKNVCVTNMIFQKLNEPKIFLIWQNCKQKQKIKP
jgi:uncharacterized DUF497 family protein